MASHTARILVADDEEGMRFVLREVFAGLGYQVVEAEDGEQAIGLLRAQPFDLAILDINMPKVDGMEVLREARRRNRDIVALVVTAYGSMELAMQAIREGAYDYFTKPFDLQDLRTTIQRAIEKKHLVDQIRLLEERVSARGEFHEIVGASDVMQDVFDMMQRVIHNDVPVLIMGESGTGKEMVVQAIHSRGPRSAGPLVKVNCAAIPEALLESELFGHEKGAFTGAIESFPGKFEQAEGGTLFLDEIGDMPLALQAKILRAVQENEVQRVGGKQPIKVNVRLVTATNRNLVQEVAAKRFREDLYFRINVIAIEMPALRRRIGDIPLLVEHFLRIYNSRLNKSVEGVSEAVMNRFLEYSWPGNIREMQNVIQRALIMTSGSRIEMDDLPPTLLRPAPPEQDDAWAAVKRGVDLSVPMPVQVQRVTAAVERAMILEALQQRTSGRQQTADLLGISRKSLHNKMREYGIQD